MWGHILFTQHFRSLAAKRSMKNKRSGQGHGGNVGVSVRKRKGKFNDQPDVFDHLATLLRKQRSQMERLSVCVYVLHLLLLMLTLFIYSSDSQKVPISPRFDSTPNSYVSLHSTQLPSEAASVDSKVQLKAKRVLFSSELGGQGFSEDEFYPDHSSTNSPTLQSFMEERGNDEVTSDEETGFSVPSLNSPNRSDGAFQAALVVS